MLTSDDLPSTFRAADRASLKAQRDAVRWRCAQLILLVVAAAAGVTSLDVADFDVAASVAGLAFAAALICELARASETPERTWYRARAGAESVKTLSWKFAVGGSPFGIDAERPDEAFLAAIGDVTRTLGDVDWAGSEDEMPRQLTPALLEVRSGPLEARQQIYRQGRIADQRAWYRSKASAARQHARLWSLAITAATALGLVAAVATVFGSLELQVLSVCSSLAAAAAAWTQFRQHEALAAAYSVAARELLLVEERLATCSDEESWSRLVDESEEAISREHTLWAAKRDIRLPA